MSAGTVAPARTTAASSAAELDPLAGRARSFPVRAVVIGLTLVAVFLAINQLFNLQLFVGLVLLDNRYLYGLAGLFLAQAFLLRPAYGGAPKERAPWYDWLLAASALGTAGYFLWNGERILMEGWEYAAPTPAVIVGAALWLLVLEATRRCGGAALFVVVLLFSLYPPVAGLLPGPIAGHPQPLPDTIAYHMVSEESSFGIPMRAFGQLVIGFIIFGAALQHTGAGSFFNDLALGLVGTLRGGAAKVAIIASGFMSSMSGSVVSNVMTTGVVSIPAMKRTGFGAPYAAGVEACASTGGVLTPPVMGATAFVMASFLGIPYVEIAVAAAIPALLFYFALFVQIDAYAARRGLRGIDRRELPGLGRTLERGWTYLAVFAVLIFFLVAARQETLAPFYATLALLLVNQVLPGRRLDRLGLARLVIGVARALAELAAVLLGVGLIIGAFSVTGLAGTLVNDLLFLAGDATLVLLLMGALTSFIFGMGMTVTACYIFLAIVLAPALTRAGLDPLAVHLFIMYWGMVSYITPPVALGAFAAATIAQTGPMRAAFEAMRLGGIIYLVPFFFVLNPALIGHGAPFEVAVVLVTAMVGICLIGAALQGYVTGIGPLSKGLVGAGLRLLMIVGGLCFAAPGGGELGLDQAWLFIAGLTMATPALVCVHVANRRREVPEHSDRADLEAKARVDEPA
jgi:TRAP transporter 4TM/12TM fusion protein